uniref:Si:ch211-207i20.3 n=1 Tax=Cyprinus carpio TaxID=7962 RepID=A0A8C2IGF7_CYPCA
MVVKMDAELLLFLVSENKELFDKNHSEYKNTKRKEVLWQGIADKMGVDVEEVKAKWKNLRDTYTRKKRLEQDGNRSGRAAKKKKQWKYMRVMDFLDPPTEHRSVILESVPGKIEDDEPDEDSGAEPASTSMGTSMTSPGAIRSDIVKRRRSETLELLERYLASKDARDREKDEQQDEVDLFLRSLAPALRRLPASKQSLVKLQIQKILHDAEFGQPSFPQISSVSPSNQLLLQCSVVKPS